MKTVRWFFFGVVACCGFVGAEDSVTAGTWWPSTVAQAVERAGDNREEMLRALTDVPVAQRPGLQFLLENMPERDLQVLSADFLLKNIALAASARVEAPWAKTIPDEIFLNQILPYANVGERREPWRTDLRTRCLPLIEGCTTAAQAAQRLNETLFSLVKVRYSTGRARADQCPAESMASGVASCTGLSILLVDACRSVGVPARLAGIPDWVDGRGNHTWVEIWDAGTWHFLGAAEPDKRGLDHAWFERDAALAQKDSVRHAIYAVSFRRTGLVFPAAWGPDHEEVNAQNVTERYTRPNGGAASGEQTVRVMVRVRNGQDGLRVNADVQITSATDSALTKTGVSKDEGADTNDMLSFDLPCRQDFDLVATGLGKDARQRFTTGKEAQQVVELVLNSSANAAETKLRQAVKEFFAASAERQAAWKFDPKLDELLKDDPSTVRRVAWEVYRNAPTQVESATDFAANRVRSGEHVSPYTLRKVGEKPAAGWGLVIAMHGGGGAPPEVNDSQWRIMQTYYRDHPESGGYLYLALRAPNDTWNGFYDDYVYPLVAKLIRQVAIGEEVNLDRVYLIGYSHGGYGAFAIGPKMPDRFAAIHSSASAPTDGLISAKTLRNTPFDFAVGELDTAYGRRERCEAFARSIQEIRGDRTDVFPVTFSLVAGRHHSDLPDRDQLKEMLPLKRQPVPHELTWEQTDSVIDRFYWLADPAPSKGHEIDVNCRDNLLTVAAHRGTGQFTVFLDERLVDFQRLLTIEHDGQKDKIDLKPSLAELCRSLLARGDIRLAFSCRIEFTAGSDGKLQFQVASGIIP